MEGHPLLERVPEDPYPGVYSPRRRQWWVEGEGYDDPVPWSKEWMLDPKKDAKGLEWSSPPHDPMLDLPDSEDEAGSSPTRKRDGQREDLFHRVKRLYVDPAFAKEPRPIVECCICLESIATFTDDNYQEPEPEPEPDPKPKPGSSQGADHKPESSQAAGQKRKRGSSSEPESSPRASQKRKRQRLSYHRNDAKEGVFLVCGHMFCCECWSEYMNTIGDKRDIFKEPRLIALSPQSSEDSSSESSDPEATRTWSPPAYHSPPPPDRASDGTYPTYRCPTCRHALRFTAGRCQACLVTYKIPYWPHGFPADEFYRSLELKGELTVEQLLDLIIKDVLPPTLPELPPQLAQPRFEKERDRFLPSRCFQCIKMEFWNLIKVIGFGLRENEPYGAIMRAILDPEMGIPDEVLAGLYSYLHCRGSDQRRRRWTQQQRDYAIAYLMDRSPTWGGSFYGPGFFRTDAEWKKDAREKSPELGRPRRPHYVPTRDIEPFSSFDFKKEWDGKLWHGAVDPQKLYQYHEWSERRAGDDYMKPRSEAQEKLGRQFAKNLRPL
ncbi:hypothetical protein QBC41DRAFT_99655 [Cercophora samala]|uniref:Uncharacterized protein n=1 Tax=Cercophora samala TaxID=330535 RepID=A0AA40DAY6_9PEZI|nr:hypothetical protein QBC41DRAFT_99655 [Cercophora samala]